MKRIFLAVTVALVVLAAAWFLGGKNWLESAVEKYSQPWANFAVPKNPAPLTGLQVSRIDDTVAVCNRGSDDWKDILVKSNDDYLSHLDRLQSGDCAQIPTKNFTTASWKRMPPPKNFQLSSVEVLATVAKKEYGRAEVNR